VLSDLFTMQEVIPISVFLAICVVVWIVLSRLSARNAGSVHDRLDRLSRPASNTEVELVQKEKTTYEAMQGLIDKAMALSKPFMPKTEMEQSALKLKLANAGFRGEHAVSTFLGIKFISLVVMALVGFAIFVPKSGFSLGSFKWVAIFGGIGMYAPSIGLWWLRRSRQQQIFLSLPDCLDLMVVCVESGLGLDSAMRRVCDEMKDVAPAICEELSLANFQLQMGRSRRDVLHDLGVRTGVDDVRSLAAILIQADRFGSSVAQALRVQSDSMRIRRRQLAEEKAAKTAVQLIFPLVLFIFPGIFVVLVGPAGIQIYDTLVGK
jgi:tight adherence protein C